MTSRPQSNKFALRTQWDLRPTPLSIEIEALRASGREVLDLTSSNPTHCGFEFPDGIEPWRGLELGHAKPYRPDAQGLREARDAVAAYYADKGCHVDPCRIFLTASTSEAYSFLFRLLADSGERIAVPTPSYPLLDYLADLSDVSLSRYSLHYDDRWWLDIGQLEALATEGLKAVVTISPNNPTGSVLSADERAALTGIVAERGIALIADEVFSDYLLEGPGHSFADASEVLTFTLSGVSKVLALPQMKLSWIVVSGPDDAVAAACTRLHVIADTFLSVAAPVQQALPGWLAQRHGIHDVIMSRLRANLGLLRQTFGNDCLHVSGGWSAVVRVPRVLTGEALCRSLLEDNVIVDPGQLYGFPDAGSLVVSLLVPTATFTRGVSALARQVARLLG